MRRIFILGCAVVCVAALVSGCLGPNSESTSSTTSSAGSTALKGTVTVFAAASLKSTFTKLADQFKTAHIDTDVNINFAGSSDLVTQLTHGAPADVFASADEKNMTKAVDAKLLSGEPVKFATNTLTIVTLTGNPKGVTSFADLAKPGVSVVVCAPQVPCGSAAQKIEQAAGVKLTPVSEESAVTDVLAKITSGQADADLVYVTDAKDAGEAVTAVPFPESSDAVNTYSITVLKDSKNAKTAQAFVDLVTGPAGRKVLAEAGFAAP